MKNLFLLLTVMVVVSICAAAYIDHETLDSNKMYYVQDVNVKVQWGERYGYNTRAHLHDGESLTYVKGTGSVPTGHGDVNSDVNPEWRHNEDEYESSFSVNFSQDGITAKTLIDYVFVGYSEESSY